MDFVRPPYKTIADVEREEREALEKDKAALQKEVAESKEALAAKDAESKEALAAKDAEISALKAQLAALVALPKGPAINL